MPKTNISAELELDDIITIIPTHYEPEDIFTYKTLANWARNEGFVKVNKKP